MLPVLLALALQAGPEQPGEGALSPPPPGVGPATPALSRRVFDFRCSRHRVPS